ncbi:FAD-binding oxidoreductase [Aspergillus mulundensis]|uniref:FAD binding containing protein n=1 Tax=Aspergillus mulundensis TaxID=1810919 RepID=A0A3D8SBS4_9EURO|nr:FAD binding containing protein [Aspergillus mulundensis]RDW83797.1 FAD binding containing protein [Aspergillus mulundensis]
MERKPPQLHEDDVFVQLSLAGLPMMGFRRARRQVYQRKKLCDGGCEVSARAAQNNPPPSLLEACSDLVYQITDETAWASTSYFRAIKVSNTNLAFQPPTLFPSRSQERTGRITDFAVSLVPNITAWLLWDLELCGTSSDSMATHLLSLLPSLRDLVSSDCQILQDPHDPEFQDRLERWSNINLQTPGAIVLPRSEEDCVRTVQWTLASSVPFVPKSGGHSRWSTIGQEGIIIDLSLYADIHVNPGNSTATLIGGVLNKEVAVRLAESGLFTALGNGNTVGAIPYFLNGGASSLSSLVGFGADQILSARLITASGELIDVSERTHPDLLWAIRGAGQFFGLVTQLVVRAHPVSMLRKQKGLVWTGRFVFPLTRAAEVAQAAKEAMDDPTYATVGMLMVMAPPPARTPIVMVNVQLLGDEDPETVFKALYDLSPISTVGADVPYENISDANDFLSAHGDFKRFGQVGLHEFDTGKFLATVEIWKRLQEQCLDAANTSFNFMWHSRQMRAAEWESAVSVYDVRFWQTNIMWHTDPANREMVDGFNEECLALLRGPDESQYVDFANGTRSGPIQYRYRGEARLAKLRELKKQWDPEGVFTKQLLD